ncbi:hypothetical protein RhiirA1_460134 [Rhizophagus irregularis]|uniref:Uncharacterized protein n=4 Tax=Rhizophagus irregularis TaxID=588596 RepID=A0A2I1EML8_9GLOM|nr:hypothetical protein RirG_104270 [Rhizophagus irregularis DAOM 197198w]PKC66123.1 hypothetical protein RhiirA1_460134 [Rhizophagus irregularis]GET53585.1 hypothetical protein GLOIN_2v1672524 [Rhizophagus irregularis DAOM 181602=DAOM 197198]PKK69571.1 hypothetical protein RhiirC2_780842 [Rhizophagus irregularis]PKY23374.1 hypothetical protein RhiirB3_437567 [Rhizophagus irregularis]
MVSPNELAAQASCYGLPYGIFGIFCWWFTFFSASLVHANCPIFAPWRWGKSYRVQGPYLTIMTSILILGPAIYTCFKCKSDWIMILVALGQLTPWAFKLMNDGFKGRKMDSEKLKLGNSYRIAGLIFTIPLSSAGWVGMTALSISLMKTEKAVSIWIWSLYVIALIAMILACCINNTTFRLIMAYIFSSLHIIGSHVIFALISNHWNGFATTGTGMASSIIFFIGKRLLFIDTNS